MPSSSSRRKRSLLSLSAEEESEGLPSTSAKAGAAAASSKTTTKTKKKGQRALRRERIAAAELDEEQQLSSLLFGSSSSTASSARATTTADLLSNVVVSRRQAVAGNNNDNNRHRADDDDDDNKLLSFEIDRRGTTTEIVVADDDNEKQQRQQTASDDDDDDDDQHDDEEKKESSTTAHSTAATAAAWVDDDDADLEINLLDQGASRLRKLRKSRGETNALPGPQFHQRLRDRYVATAQLTARTDWARLDTAKAKTKNDIVGAVTSASDQTKKDSFSSSSTAGPLLRTASSRQRLPSGTLNVVRCPDANLDDPNQATVQAAHFHPASDPNRPLLLTAGFDKTLRFFQVGDGQDDDNKSHKVHGIHFPKLPIFSAAFLGASSGRVIVTGRRQFFYLYDSVAGKLDQVPRILGRDERSLERCVASPHDDDHLVAFCGNDGYVLVYDTHQKQLVAELKMNGSVRAMAFSAGNSGRQQQHEILASGSDGDVYRWDLRYNAARRCVERFSNEDGTITSSLAVSGNHIAVGAESGVVNIYGNDTTATAVRSQQRHSSSTRRRDPIKSIMNLQTSVDMVRFNGDGQILALSSKREKHALKLLHVPSATVFANWPTSKTPLNYVSCHDFSPGSRFVVMGNDKGKCLLYRLTHYS